MPFGWKRRERLSIYNVGRIDSQFRQVHGRSKPLPDQLHKTSRNCYRDRLQCPKLKSFRFRKTCPLRMPLLVGPPPVGGKDIPFERDFG